MVQDWRVDMSIMQVEFYEALAPIGDLQQILQETRSTVAQVQSQVAAVESQLEDILLAPTLAPTTQNSTTASPTDGPTVSSTNVVTAKQTPLIQGAVSARTDSSSASNCPCFVLLSYCSSLLALVRLLG